MSVSSVSISSSTGQTSSSVDRSGLTEEEAVTDELLPYTDQIDTIETSIDTNETKLDYYQYMQSLLLSLEDSVDSLSSPTDGTTDVFSERIATLSSTGSTSASSIMSVSAATSSATGTHTIVVSQLAAAERITSGSQTSESAALGLSGSFTLSEAGNSAATISITANMSLSDIETAINDESSSTGVTASIIAVSSTSYQLLLTANDTDQAIEMSTLSGSSLSTLGLTEADGSTAADILQSALPAMLSVDGISGIERSTNDIDDILSGVTLNLTQADSGTTITMDITPDTDSVATAISDFVTAYNSWRSFVDLNQETDSSGGAGSSAILFGDSTLRDTSTEIDDAITSFIDGTSLSAIGISLNSSNELSINSSTLDDALENNFSLVQTLFEYQATTSSGDLSLVSHVDATYSGSFTLNITTDSAGNISGVSGEDASGNAVDFTYSGNTITGASGTAYAGLTFQFNGTSSESIGVSASQGVADQLMSVAGAAGNTASGTVEEVIQGLQSEDTQDQQQVTDLQSEADDYETFLLDQYGTLEAQISEANMTQSILQEMMSSSNSS